MKTVIITEGENIPASADYTLDLAKAEVQDCIGCWSCWWKTPGRCAFKDLDEFYHHYVTADRAIIVSQVTKGFVSGKLKTLFDRMIPLYLPYTEYSTGESMHVPRYGRYPDIEFYYQGTFVPPDGRQIFVDYIQRVFYQFHSKNIVVKPIGERNS
ncbi:MAG: NAD(P)H-dependent oxidoreductase [Spirochaetaceae bacterium]|nr:NAD(P)H-dependent oxidoreductase [Spirochaetaceae bacterium]MCF7948993.1 NAD(P)H-dependent oxidoreductase [Spirochaetia bacterium]MCF7952034.1 NAD(P)H-dependent oxidoreductase [Spirochaetaceae bacterium]